MSHSRGAFTAQISRKRKERDDDLFLFQNSSNNNNSNGQVKGKQVQPPPRHPKTTSSVPKPSDPDLSNRILAGYMAHEFLTNGTLLGQKFDPARTPPVPLFSEPAPTRPDPKSYAEVASLLKTDRVHIAGIVNPSHLAKWIQR